MRDPSTATPGDEPVTDNGAPRTTPRLSRSWKLWGWLNVAILTASLALWWAAPKEPKPVAQVREFLTAVQQKRVADALDLAGWQRNSSEESRFLTPAALNGDWEIVALEASSYIDGYEVEEPSAAVDVAIRAGAVTRKFTLHLTKTGRGARSTWRITNPFARVSFPATALLYVEVNGVKAPMQRSARSSGPYHLFPGLYRFYSNIPGIATIRSTPQLIAPDVDTPTGDIAADTDDGEAAIRIDYRDTGVTLTKQAKRKVRDAAHDLIDRCVEAAALRSRTCPFSVGDTDPTTPEHPVGTVKNFRNITWKVVTYPELTVVPTLGAIALSNRTLGSMKLTVTATDTSTGRKVTYSISCVTRFAGFSVLITKDATIRVVTPHDRYGEVTNPASGEKPPVLAPTDTCHRDVL